MNQLPQLRVLDTPSIGFPLAEVHAERDTVMMNNAQFRQIMEELLELRIQVADIRERVYTPWYIRLWRALWPQR
jgi:hypothetical protein